MVVPFVIVRRIVTTILTEETVAHAESVSGPSRTCQQWNLSEEPPACGEMEV